MNIYNQKIIKKDEKFKFKILNNKILLDLDII